MYNCNYYRLDHFSFFSDLYMYIDTRDHLADPIFIRHMLPVRFIKHLSKEGTPYQIILCKAPKGRRNDFLSCMEALTRKMLLCGHTDYCSFCMDIQDQISGFLRSKQSGAVSAG